MPCVLASVGGIFFRKSASSFFLSEIEFRAVSGKLASTDPLDQNVPLVSAKSLNRLLTVEVAAFVASNAIWISLAADNSASDACLLTASYHLASGVPAATAAGDWPIAS